MGLRQVSLEIEKAISEMLAFLNTEGNKNQGIACFLKSIFASAK